MGWLSRQSFQQSLAWGPCIERHRRRKKKHARLPRGASCATMPQSMPLTFLGAVGSLCHPRHVHAVYRVHRLTTRPFPEEQWWVVVCVRVCVPPQKVGGSISGRTLRGDPSDDNNRRSGDVQPYQARVIVVVIAIASWGEERRGGSNTRDVLDRMRGGGRCIRL